MARTFEWADPDPKDPNHRRRRRRLKEKGRKCSQLMLNWAAKYDAKVAAIEAALMAEPVASPVAATSPPSPPEAKPDEVGVPEVAADALPAAPLPEARSAVDSSAKPAPVPALAASVKVPAASSPPVSPRAAPNPPSTPVAASPPTEEAWFGIASPQIQAARHDALVMIFDQVADGFEQLHLGVEKTMQGQKWALPVTFWKGPWLTMAVGLFNRYLPEWMSGPIVEGVTVVMPPVSLIRAAQALEKAGYTIGVPGEPGRGKALGAAPSPAKAPEPPPAPKPAEPKPEGQAAPARPAREGREDSTANPPARRNGEKVEPRSLFAKGN